MCFRKMPIKVCMAYMLHLLASIACLLGYIAPFWLLFPEFSSMQQELGLRGDELSEGLWAFCVRHDGKCIWFWQKDFELQSQLPVWHKAAQGLCSAGILVLLINYVVASVHVCCRAWRGSQVVTAVLASFNVLAVVLIASSLAVYGGFNAQPDVRSARVDAGNTWPKFYWGFFIVVAGLIAAVISAALLYLDACRGGRKDGYKPAASQIV